MLILLGTLFLMAVTGMSGNAASPGKEGTDARALLDRFRAIDWDIRAAMSKQPTQEDTAWKTRLEIEHQLALLGPEAVPTLLQSLGESNRHVRALAAYVLGVRGEKRAEAMLRALVTSDKDATVRLYAAEALGRIGDRVSVPLLASAQKTDENPNVRYAAEQALLRLRSPATTPNRLLALVRAFDPQQMAVAQIGKPAPDFTLETEAGQPMKLSDFRGKQPVILLFQLADW